MRLTRLPCAPFGNCGRSRARKTGRIDMDGKMLVQRASSTSLAASGWRRGVVDEDRQRPKAAAAFSMSAARCLRSARSARQCRRAPAPRSRPHRLGAIGGRGGKDNDLVPAPAALGHGRADAIAGPGNKGDGIVLTVLALAIMSPG